MTRFLFFVLLLLVSLLVEGQVCNNSSRTLTTQAQVNDFGTTFSTCSAVRLLGSLTIMGDDITDLTPLSKIQYVGGRVSIHHLPQLSSLYGLHNLDSTGTNLTIFEVPLISNLSGLSSLKKVGTANNGLAGIAVSDCESISSLNGLQNITHLERLQFSNNPSLTNFSGLENLQVVSDFFTLDETSIGGRTLGIINFVGLQSLRSVGSFTIQRLTNIIDFSGLDNLEVIQEWNISNVQSLGFSVDGLSNLTTVERQLMISQNPGLQNVNLSTLRSIGETVTSFATPMFQIQLNDALQSVVLPDDLTNVGTIDVSQNPSLTTISGLGNLRLLPNRNNVRSLSIISNNSLTDLSGLKPTADIGGLFIEFNPLLETCEVPLICDHLSSGGSPNINNNAAGCNSVSEVEAACNALPVTWSSFTAGTAAKSVWLQWATNHEENNAGYTVEHSLNGLAFQPIQHLRPRPQNVEGTHRYEYFHENTIGGTHYYRIRQEDLDGSVSYSPIREVQLVGSDEFRVFPTVVSETLTVEMPREGELRILSVTGRLMFLQSLPAGGTALALGSWPTGVYFVQTDRGDQKRIVCR